MLNNTLLSKFCAIISVSSGHVQKVNNKRKFQTFSFNSGDSSLREVVTCKRFQIWRFHLEMFSSVENWSLSRGDHS